MPGPDADIPAEPSRSMGRFSARDVCIGLATASEKERLVAETQAQMGRNKKLPAGRTWSSLSAASAISTASATLSPSVQNTRSARQGRSLAEAACGFRRRETLVRNLNSRERSVIARWRLSEIRRMVPDGGREPSTHLEERPRGHSAFVDGHPRESLVLELPPAQLLSSLVSPRLRCRDVPEHALPDLLRTLSLRIFPHESTPLNDELRAGLAMQSCYACVDWTPHHGCFYA